MPRRFTIAGSASAGTATPSRASADADYNEQLLSLDSFGRKGSFDPDADEDHDRTYAGPEDEDEEVEEEGGVAGLSGRGDRGVGMDGGEAEGEGGWIPRRRRQAREAKAAGGLGAVPIMVATDLAARGLDFAGAQVGACRAEQNMHAAHSMQAA